MASDSNTTEARKEHRTNIPPPLNLNMSGQRWQRLSHSTNNVTSNSSDCGIQEYKTAREYARELGPWLHHYRLWTSTFPHQMLSCAPPINPLLNVQPNVRGVPPQTTGTTPLGGRVPATTPVAGRTTHVQVDGEYIIPPLWKRILAELVDFVVLFYMKIIVTIIILRQMGYLRDDNNILDVHIDLMPVLDLADVDLDKALNLTSEIIALEVVNRVFITLFETLCIRQGYGSVGGATPGKRILGLKVVSCEEVLVPVDFRNGRVIVIPAQNVGIVSALVRSTIKNFTMAFLFPACFTVFFFRHNRAAYDVIAKTIVVQAPLPHRQQHQ